MPRLTKQEWETIKDDFEVRGRSVSEIAKSYGVQVSSISRQAKKQKWKQGQKQKLVQDQVEILRKLDAVEKQKQMLPKHTQAAIEYAVATELELAGLRTTYHAAIYRKGLRMLQDAESAAELKTLSSVARDLMPQKEPAQINISQAQAQAQQMTPDQVMQELLSQEQADDVSDP